MLRSRILFTSPQHFLHFSYTSTPSFHSRDCFTRFHSLTLHFIYIYKHINEYIYILQYIRKFYEVLSSASYHELPFASLRWLSQPTPPTLHTFQPILTTSIRLYGRRTCPLLLYLNVDIHISIIVHY